LPPNCFALHSFDDLTKEQYYSAKQIIVRGKPIIVRTKTIIVRAKPIIVRAKPIIVRHIICNCTRGLFGILM
jgi:hypothetical protein